MSRLTDPVAIAATRIVTALVCPALIVLSLAFGAVLAARLLRADSARAWLDRAERMCPEVAQLARELDE